MDESTGLALLAIFIIFVVFYTLSYYTQPNNKEQFALTNYNLKAAELSLKNNWSKNWSGLDEKDKTVVMQLKKNKLMLNQPPPLSATVSRSLVNQEYGKTF